LISFIDPIPSNVLMILFILQIEVSNVEISDSVD
jgi:hypothetical protein